MGKAKESYSIYIPYSAKTELNMDDAWRTNLLKLLKNVWDVYSQIMVSWLKLIDLTKRLNQSHQQKSQLKLTINYL